MCSTNFISSVLFLRFVVQLLQNELQLFRDWKFQSSGIFQKGNTFVRNVEEDNRSTQHTTYTDDLHIQNVCNTDQNKDQHLPADSPESNFTR